MRLKRLLLLAVDNSIRRASERAYLTLWYRWRYGRWPALHRPASFSEHLLDYKLRSRGDPRFSRLADKIMLKGEIEAVVGAHHAVPTLWYGAKLPPRNDRNWPKPYVLKSSHACGQVIFVRSAQDEDWDSIERTTHEWLSSSYDIGRRDGEWHYAGIERRLLVEPMLGDGEATPDDYKLYVFGGRVSFITVDEGRYEDPRRYTFDQDWNAMPFEAGEKRGEIDPPRPPTLPQMIEMAEKLGRSFEFVRVDFYDVSGRLLIGEMTFFPGGGSVHFNPPDGDYLLGRHWRPLQRTAEMAQPCCAMVEA